MGKIEPPVGTKRGAMTSLIVLLILFQLCVTVISWPVMTSKFVDEISSTGWIWCGWAYAITLVGTVLWITTLCFSSQDDYDDY